MQSIGVRAGGGSEDVITHIGYDAIGRQAKDYLPYAALTTPGSYRTGASGSTDSYYITNYSTEISSTTPNPYSEKHFENSPLNRVLEQTAPGISWKYGSTIDSDGHSNGHSIKFGYQNNAEGEVRNFGVTLSYSPTYMIYIPSLTLIGNYEMGKLYKTITKDENWQTSDGTNHTTEEFKDKLGRVILKRTYGPADLNGDGDTSDSGESLATYDTYYVYDNYGNLTYVLPPKMEPTTALFSSITNQLDELGYQYKYDGRNRLVEKKIPGKDWEYIVYDNLDRPVMTQDGNQRVPATDEWLVTKYDALGRVVYTSIYRTNDQRYLVQQQFNNKTGVASNYEDKVTTGIGYGGIYYTNSDYPVITSSNDILTVNYYDNYYFNKDGLSLPSSYEGQTIINYNNATNTQKLTRGLPTGTRVRVLGTATPYWITTLTGYDVKARPIYATTKNGYLQTTDNVKNKLDFIGQSTKTESVHIKSGTTITVVDNFNYDQMGRLTRQTQAINGDSTPEVIVDNTYDKLGQLITKGVGNDTLHTRLQTVDYTYNIRGWLKGINNTGGSNSTIALGSGDLFGFQVNYNNPSTGTALYNGNISQTLWKTANTDSSVRYYKYTYDPLNRIKTAIDNSADQRYSLTGVVYDKNGNITSLVRKGHTALDGNGLVTAYGTMDNLKYYYDSGNKLMKVTDIASIDQYGFKDDAVNTAVDNSDDYNYDVNGNMIKDENKGITGITYNYLNLPATVTINGQNISYIYDALGVKLQKSVNGTITSYAGNYIYEKVGTGLDVLQFFNTPEGYVSPNGSSWDYIYRYKDHLGNIRLSYTDANQNNGNPVSLQIIEENNYYPFGLKQKGYNIGGATSLGNNVAQRFKFNGQEFDDSFGNFNMYEMDMRQYDPAISRWTSIDPVTHHSMSTYTAFDNNPVFWADPSGADSWMYMGDGVYRNRRTDEETTDWQRAVSETVGKSTNFSDSTGPKPPKWLKGFINWFNGNGEYDGSGWGYGLRNYIKKKLNLDDKSASLVETGILSILESKKIELEGDALEKIKIDPDVINYESSIVLEALANQNFKRKAFSFTTHKTVQLGGDRARGNMWDQLKDPLNPNYSDTWKVAMNELTWLVRSVTVYSTVQVSSDGKVTMNHSFSDIFDLRPSPGNRSDAYNKVTTILGFLYHDVLGGNDKMRVNASWTTSIQK